MHCLYLPDAAFSGGFAHRTKSARSATAFGIGLNWYMTRSVRMKIDDERINFDSGVAGTAVNPNDRASEQLIETQL